jgi:hypothetical protein
VALNNFILNRKIKKTQRNVQFFNYETAKTIGILYKIENKHDFETVKEYSSYLSGKDMKVFSLGFVVNSDEIGTVYFGQGETNYFSEKHISKSGKIKETCVSEFIANELDVLVNLANPNNFYLEYVFALSKAKFKVSGIIDCKYSDLNINNIENKDIHYFIEQVNHYLNTIKKA